MLARHGQVAYWFVWTAAAVCVAIAVVTIVKYPNDWMAAVIVSLPPALIFWITGYAIKYLSGGKMN
jgi:hypothetical protein